MCSSVSSIFFVPTSPLTPKPHPQHFQCNQFLSKYPISVKNPCCPSFVTKQRSGSTAAVARQECKGHGAEVSVVFLPFFFLPCVDYPALISLHRSFPRIDSPLFYDVPAAQRQKPPPKITAAPRLLAPRLAQSLGLNQTELLPTAGLINSLTTRSATIRHRLVYNNRHMAVVVVVTRRRRE